MSAASKIEWTDSTWNPIRGCTRVSEGCRNCYAEVMAARFSKPGQWGHGIAEMRGGDHRWTGRVDVIESAMNLPLRWRKPRRIFVNSISDLFHDAVPDETIERVFAVMALCPQHTFIVLTKRSRRVRAFMNEPNRVVRAWGRCFDGRVPGWPLQNVHLGVSVEDQKTADERIPDLLATPAAVRIVSAEPLLGPIDFAKVPGFNRIGMDLSRWWIIVGGESGPGARPMHQEWVRSIRNQCDRAGVSFFFKQWGGVVKKLAGRQLDGREWNEMPSSVQETPPATD